MSTIMISDDELLLYAYRDGLSAERMASITRSLQADPQLQQRWRMLQDDLALLTTPVAADLSESLQKRLQGALVQQALLDRQRAAMASSAKAAKPAWSWLMPTALAACLVLGIAIGLRWQAGEKSLIGAPDSPQTTLASNTKADSSKLARTLLLVTEANAERAQRVKPEQRAALMAQILASNKQHQRMALNAGDLELARALRAIAPILQSMADPNATAADIAGSYAKLDFELQIMQTKRQAATSNGMQTL